MRKMESSRHLIGATSDSTILSGKDDKNREIHHQSMPYNHCDGTEWEVKIHLRESFGAERLLANSCNLSPSIENDQRTVLSRF